ncbi:hypothetical protein CFOL_v3_01573, partial [Cephalotus follicularis]
MEDGQNMDASGTQDNYMTKPLDQRDCTKSRSDIMLRRLKNRERQRRYRAKKRLEAEKKRSSVINQSTTPQVELQLNELQLNGNHNACITRIHCKRDWKKDARRAHARKYQDSTANFATPPPTLTNGIQTVCVASGTMVDSPLERNILHEKSFSPVNCETQKPIIGRRDWKAEARNKNN